MRVIRALIVAFAIALSPYAYAAFAIFQVAGPSTTFTHVQIGGAGAVSGIFSVPSANLLLSRTDQYGCYKSIGNAQWSELITTTAMPSTAVLNADGGPAGDIGCDELVGDPATPANYWVMYNGGVYFSSNSGASFSATCFPAESIFANVGPQKLFSRKIAVDPNNSSIVYVGAYSGSLSRTINQGSTCSTVGTLATPTTVGGNGGGYLIAFDPSGGTTASCAGGASICTKSIYVSVYGTGVYHSNDGGQTWTLTSGTPTTHQYMIVDAVGVVWLVDAGTGNGLGTAHKYNGTWSAPVFTHDTIVTAVAFDPNNCASTSTCHVAFIVGGGGTSGGTTALTQDSGSTWTVATGYTSTTTDLPWLANVWNTIGLFPSGLAFDNSGHLYTGLEGIGTATPPTTATTIAMSSQTAGVEEFLTSSISTSPGTSGSVIVAGWDVGCFTLSAPYTSFPTSGQHGCAGQTTFQHGYSLDWTAPTDFVSLVDNQQGYGGGTYAGHSGISIDGGGTWTAFAAIPAAITTGGRKGGCMAASSATNILWMPTDGGAGATAPFYTTDGFATSGNIHQISVAGVTQGWGSEYFFNNHQCAADRVTAGVFYIYNSNTGSGTPSDGFIKCTGGGASCTRVSSPGFGPNEQINPNLKTMPGQASTFFFSYGTNDGLDVAGNGFYFTTDGGTTINAISGFTNVTGFGFGAAFPGHTMPAIVAAGYFNHVYGIWRSIDWDGARTWQQIGTFPMNLPLPVLDIDGDKSVPGVFYYGQVSGVICGSPSPTYCNGGT